MAIETTTITSAIRSYLLTIPAITSMIGDRCFSDTPPSVDAEMMEVDTIQESLDDYPCITIVLAGTKVLHYIAGQLGLHVALLKVSAYAKTRSEALALANRIQCSGLTSMKGYCHGTDIRNVVIEEGTTTDSHWIKHLGKNARIAEAGFYLSITYQGYSE